MNQPPNRRILLIDDTPSIHDDFRKILMPTVETNQALDDLESALFGDTDKPEVQAFELHSAYGGEEGLQLLSAAMADKRPYALAFVDMRMPQGWDGAKTIEELWKVDPGLQVVVCTAYTDYSWDDLLYRLKGHDRLLILKSPSTTSKCNRWPTRSPTSGTWPAAPPYKPATWSNWWRNAPWR